MMLQTRLDFGGSPTPSIGVEWWGMPLSPIKRLPGQLTGLGACWNNDAGEQVCDNLPAKPPTVTPLTVEEARVILASGSPADRMAEAQKVYYDWYNANRTASPASCGADPQQSSVSLMSSPLCQPTNTVCISLLQQIEEYNLALAKQAENNWNKAWCEKQNCLNQGTAGYPRDCGSLFPRVNVPPQPVYPDAKSILQQGGVVVGYSSDKVGSYGGGSGSGSGANYSDEVEQARQIYVDLLNRYGVAANSTVTGLFNQEFAAGVAWYKSTYGNTTGLAKYVASNADGRVQEWMRKAGVTKADGTTNNSNTGGGSGTGSSGGNVNTSGGGGGGGGGSSDNTSADNFMLGDSGGMFIALGAVALLMLAGKGK